MGTNGEQLVQVTGNPQQASLLPIDKKTTGRGTALAVGGNKNLRIEVWGTGSYIVQIEAIGASGTARALPVWDITGMTFVASNNKIAAGFYDIDVQGFSRFQANVTSISGGNVNASGRLML
ncbi:hypothetical protein V1498_20545 [Peribacillus sp. SCS-26]|uniref:hypothetical protein n=1 Tax=Paraperibacillus marinus TaxID=3115295 RepID=UPI00390630F2